MTTSILFTEESLGYLENGWLTVSFFLSIQNENVRGIPQDDIVQIRILTLGSSKPTFVPHQTIPLPKKHQIQTISLPMWHFINFLQNKVHHSCVQTVVEVFLGSWHVWNGSKSTRHLGL